MADSDDKRNFTDKLLSSDTNAKRVSEIEDQLDADTKETYRLRHLADLQPMGMVSTGGYQAGDDSARGNGMEILLARRFFAAVERGDAITVLAYIRIGYDINIRRERLGDTALHIAAARDAKDVLKLLIESVNVIFSCAIIADGSPRKWPIFLAIIRQPRVYLGIRSASRARFRAFLLRAGQLFRCLDLLS